MKQNASSSATRENSLVEAMLAPTFYPSHPEEILHKETHISHVFLAGELVYKIKKPVRFTFLDFSTLAKRRHFLESELALNRRLAPAIYLGIVPIFHDLEGWSLEGEGKPAEHALLMRRLPQKRMLDYLLETGQATVPLMEQLADLIAGFHAAAQKIVYPPKEHQAAARSGWQKNISELEPLVPDDDHRAELEAIAAAGRDFLRRKDALIGRRASGGWVRDVHGDLHAEHICFAPEGIQIFDCIEFSEELRRCDLASEIAFLLMDLSVRQGGALVQPFLQRYLQWVSDADMPTLLPFYECHRALVRAKVHALRWGRWNSEAARYFDCARRSKWQLFQPFLILMSGFTGSGKSTLARALGQRLGIAVAQSDEVRKSIAGKQSRQIVPLNEGIYTREMTDLTYGSLASAAETSLQSDRSMIVDATFGAREQRARFIRLAERRKAPLLVIRCLCSDAATAERLQSRAAAGTDISDGRWEVYVAQKASYEPMSEIEASARLELCTEAPLENLVRQAEAFLREQLSSETKPDL